MGFVRIVWQRRFGFKYAILYYKAEKVAQYMKNRCQVTTNKLMVINFKWNNWVPTIKGKRGYRGRKCNQDEKKNQEWLSRCEIRQEVEVVTTNQLLLIKFEYNNWVPAIKEEEVHSA